MYDSNVLQSIVVHNVLHCSMEIVDNICDDTIKVLLTLKLSDGVGFKTRNDGPDHVVILMLRFFR